MEFRIFQIRYHTPPRMKRSKTIHRKLYNELVDELCLERKRLGLSQNEVAKCLGMTQSEISKMETHERRIDILELREILNIYRVSENKKLQSIIKNFFEVG